MAKVAILQANLGGFDTPKDPVKQNIPTTFHRFTDENFPPITGLTPRFQYRIPKLFGWQMFPGYDYYIWLDGSVSLQRPDCVEWYLKQLGDGDMAFFKHPNRKTIREEVDHLENYSKRKDGTKRGQDYVIRRYENGLHKEQLEDIQLDKDFKDGKLYASTTFIYKDSEEVRDALRLWWLHQSRYWTCDQVALPYVVRSLAVKTLNEPIYKSGYISLVSQHN